MHREWKKEKKKKADAPTSTSQPMSAKPLAITLLPRSCPSWPIFATRMRGRRPAAVANPSIAACVALNSSADESLALTCWSTQDTGCKQKNMSKTKEMKQTKENMKSLTVSAYAPCTTEDVTAYRPHFASSASEISPTLQRARAAATARRSKFCG